MTFVLPASAALESCQWSDEWEWLGIDFDGFKPQECLLQEAKGNYDQFLDGSIPKSEQFFKGFRHMRDQAIKRAMRVKANPPTRLRYYFQGPLTYRRMSVWFKTMSIESEYFP
ncbi:restriction endonuclease fold toxin 5 domain-containing protein [Burkholderia cepacia]|uniref:restriction endonuclease fold toxin 5 domain-containing protein n=1 Tax=Burkholderia cepacia TaxID=292 RepID=UPI00285289A1|nr:restriction endonuclease fold toxin 5 domain-containing protein [Burkholderia cepacia]